MKEEKEFFFQKIDHLDSGERAVLRRNVGKLLRQADGRAITVFYRCLPFSVNNWYDEDKWFAVACIRCLWEPNEEDGQPLEQIISDLLQKEMLSDSVRHRIGILLDTDWDTDGYLLTKLTRLMKLIRSKSDRAQIDCAELLDDLIYWNRESQSVQRKWAKTIFSK